MNARWLGLVVVAVLAWNAAFSAAGRFGIFVCVGLAALVAFLRALAVPTPWRELFAPRTAALVAAAAATGLLVALTAFFAAPVLHALPALDDRVRGLYALFGTPTAVQAYVLLPLIALAEELVFRGAIQGGLVARLGGQGAALAAAAIYACAHVASRQPVLVGLAFVLGWFWGALRARSRSLLPGVVSHIVWDLFVIVWAPLDAARAFHV